MKYMTQKLVLVQLCGLQPSCKPAPVPMRSDCACPELSWACDLMCWLWAHKTPIMHQLSLLVFSFLLIYLFKFTTLTIKVKYSSDRSMWPLYSGTTVSYLQSIDSVVILSHYSGDNTTLNLTPHIIVGLLPLCGNDRREANCRGF